MPPWSRSVVDREVGRGSRFVADLQVPAAVLVAWSFHNRTSPWAPRYSHLLLPAGIQGLLPVDIQEGWDGDVQWTLMWASKLLLVFHPNVLFQSLHRGCHIFTLVTLGFTRDPRWGLQLLLGNELLSPLGISPKSWGAWLLAITYILMWTQTLQPSQAQTLL